MPVSANALIHFTEKLEDITGILSNNFYPRLSLEEFTFGSIRSKLAFPMVCFCDIPLHLIQCHLDEYGCYGIGLSKKWGQNKGLNPVMYIKSGSYLSNHMTYMLKFLIDNDFENDPLIKNHFMHFVGIMSYIKQYSGTANDMAKVFYNEREWRYVPDILSLPDDKLPWLFEQQYNQNKSAVNSDLMNSPLTFEAEDISYIIIKNELERPHAIELIRNVKLKLNHSEERIRLLLSKIISTEQIKNDL